MLALRGGGAYIIIYYFMQKKEPKQKKQIYEESFHKTLPQSANIIPYSWFVGTTCAFFIGLFSGRLTNLYHAFSYLALIFSITYLLFVFNVLMFASQLYAYTVDYKLLKGSVSNFVPAKVSANRKTPWSSISHLAHVRGSFIYQWHTTLMHYCSFSLLVAAITKLIEINEEHPSTRIAVSVYLLLFGALGGFVLTNFEVYVSNSFSERYNFLSEAIHLAGAFSYLVIGNFSFALYSSFSIFSCFLLTIAVIGLIAHMWNKQYQYKKYKGSDSSEDDHEWAHAMSKFNIATEIGAIIPSAIAMCTLVYQLGDR